MEVGPLVEDDLLAEIYLERENEYTLAGSIYKGRVTRVLPGMQSAFVDIGLERDAFLYVSDFFEDNEEYDKIVSEAEDKVLKYDRPQAGASRITPSRAGLTRITLSAEQSVPNAWRSVKRKVVPSWPASSNQRRPPCASMIVRDSANPMPVPSDLVVKKGLKS